MLFLMAEFDLLKCTLRDGTPVVIRPIVPQDRDKLIDGLKRLSEQSRYRRFMSPIQMLTDKQLNYLTEIDYINHMAVGAADPLQPNEPGLGVARCVRVKDEPNVAETAVVVVDSHQKKGLGTLLLGVLERWATKNGIDTFRAYVLESNKPMRDMLRDLGAKVRKRECGTVEVDVPVPKNPDDYPDTPIGRVFKAVARELIPALEIPFKPAYGIDLRERFESKTSFK